MDFPIKSFSPSRKVSPPCLPLLSLGTQQPPGDLYSGNIIITSTTLIVNINDHSLRISFSSQGLNSTDGANNRWQNGKRWEEEKIFSKYCTFSHLQMIHFNIHICILQWFHSFWKLGISCETLLRLAPGKNRPPPSALRPGGKSTFRPFSGKKGGKLSSFVCHGKRAENIPNSALQFF